MPHLARDQLWELASDQQGYVTMRQADDLGITRGAVDQLIHRGTLIRAAFGIYRFPKYPGTIADPYMLAVLWSRVPEAALSHETVLDVFEVCDVNPDIIHVTVPKDRRLRRSDGTRFRVHYQDLDPGQLAWWQEVPAVTLATAVAQCIDYGTPTYLLLQALENGHRLGRLTRTQRDELTVRLEGRSATAPHRPVG